MFDDLGEYAGNIQTNGLKKDGSKIKVLIVDDALAIRRLLRRILEGVGYDVVGEEGDGMSAVAKYPQLGPDVVTMDVTMPEMDGSVAVDAIRRNHPDARIVMITSIGDKNLVEECLKAGAKGYILKPIQEKQITKMLETIKKAAVEG